jgi:hypothetical protein
MMQTVQLQQAPLRKRESKRVEFKFFHDIGFRFNVVERAKA